MNVQPMSNGYNSKNNPQNLNGKKIKQANDIEFKNDNHLCSMRPNIST